MQDPKGLPEGFRGFQSLPEAFLGFPDFPDFPDFLDFLLSAHRVARDRFAIVNSKKTFSIEIRFSEFMVGFPVSSFHLFMMMHSQPL